MRTDFCGQPSYSSIDLINFAKAISSYLLGSSKFMTSEMTKLAYTKIETSLIKKMDVNEKDAADSWCHDESAQKWTIRVLSC